MTMPSESSNTRLSTADFAAVTEDRRRAEAPEADVPMPAETEPVERRSEDRPDTRQPAAPLFRGNDGDEFHRRWSDVQASFVDEPRHAVEQADSLVAEVMQRLASGFAEERHTLEQQWARGGDADTEELRLAFQRYRAFFDRLLAV